MPSSVIRAMRFDPVRRVLEIVFRGARGVYRYLNVPAEEWRLFRGAPSKGAYLNGFFKAQGYVYEKVATPARHGDDLHREYEAEPLLWGDVAVFPEAPARRRPPTAAERDAAEELAA